MEAPVLEVRDVVKQYASVRAVDELSFECSVAVEVEEAREEAAGLVLRADPQEKFCLFWMCAWLAVMTIEQV